MNLFRAFLLAFAVAGPAAAETVSVDGGSVQVDRMVAGLQQPWAIAFLPEGGLLITERDGRLLNVQGGQSREVAGVPRVVDEGQGGLLDVVLARDFATTRTLFLSYSAPIGRGAGTALASATLSPDGAALSNVRVLFQMERGSGAGQHFGSRIVEAPDGTLFLTIGDRGDRNRAQDADRYNGKVVRINRDGSIPSDNPIAMTDGPYGGQGTAIRKRV
ncbi:MAG: PQQ-dependent sugar dehydrogenase, partial [Pseudomonadota bacterium]